ncbi:MAG: serine/threonine-protein kinase [Azonexus sp.]
MSLAQLGRFKITGTLGQGAMGTVYRAHDPLLDRTVAIKTVGCAGMSREEAAAFEERFYCEARSAGRLNHPNIVTIHDVGRSDDLAYIAMEYLNGHSLREILDSSVVLPVERSADIAAQIADGLAFAHANGVVHRDIKPANIMVFDNGTVKIADFGVAQMSSGAQTVAGATFGSPKYMSPEQVSGQKVDGRSDVFSLGAVFYEMLVGRPPFTGDDLHAILYQVLNGAPPLPSTFIPNLPHGFDRIVARALAKNPDKRFQSVAEMAAALRKYRRIVRQAEKEQLGAGAAPATAGPGDATMLVKTVKAPVPAKKVKAPKANALRYAVPLFLLVVLVGWLVFNAAQPSASAASPASVPVPDKQAAEPAPAAPALASVEPAQVEPGKAPVALVPAPAAGGEAEVAKAPAGNGRIRLAIAPWGEVRVDGKMLGVSPPLNEIRLPAGKHSIEIRNGNFAPHRQTIDLAGDASLRIKHKFE